MTLKYFITIFFFLLGYLKLPAQELKISGKVLSLNGDPIAAASIKLKQAKNIIATSDENGNFTINKVESNQSLVISCVGYEMKEVVIGNQNNLVIKLIQKKGELDEVIVQAYGITSRRLNTGNITRIDGKEISKQPVSNPLLALQGQVAGLQVRQTSGLPGSFVTAQIRGINSLENGSQPLFIIDGVPFMLNNGVSLSAQISPVIIQSPLNSINPLDIESIEVLKDADATAIYGSQGANGVILITTKSSKSGKTQWDINYHTGVGKVTQSMNLLNTSDYREMRKEAFRNDNAIPTISNAPDLLSWDSLKYTNWKDYFLGGSAQIHNVQSSLSAGNSNTQFQFNGNYNAEGTVFPESSPNERGTLLFKISNSSPNKKFKSQFTSSYSIDSKKLPSRDLTSYIYLAPNTPDLFNANHQLNWVDGTENPMSFIFQKFESKTKNLLINALLQYQLLPELTAKVNMGFNQMNFEERSVIPIKAQRPNPTQPPTGTSTISTSNLNGWIIEPQLEYIRNISAGKLTLLAGASFQNRRQESILVTASNYTNDDMLEILSAAPRVALSNNEYLYRYNAFFGRINYNWRNKYLVNLNARRDGSSRFGPANRFANFGSGGLGWIFSEESFFKNLFPFVSYGKLRGSYGVTGNDQISDYQYLDLWGSSSSYQYQGLNGVLQQRLFNPYLEWERTKKLELGIDLSILNERILLASSYYKNRSDNQLISYTLPSQTGFTSIRKNLDAVIQNSGWELDISLMVVRRIEFSWKSVFNFSLPSNKLIKYPGLENSADKNKYIIGESLRVLRQYNYLGVDPSKGIYTFQDVNGDGVLNISDYVKIGASGVRYFGGWQNTVTFKNFQGSFLFEFSKQTSQISYLPTAPGIFDATYSNQLTSVLQRWTKNGDAATIQRFTATTSSQAYLAYSSYRSSSASLIDASYIRLKNLYLAYDIPIELLSRLKMRQLRCYMQGQNLLTFTNVKGFDPETQSFFSLPPLTIYTVGIQLGL